MLICASLLFGCWLQPPAVYVGDLLYEWQVAVAEAAEPYGFTTTTDPSAARIRVEFPDDDPHGYEAFAWTQWDGHMRNYAATVYIGPKHSELDGVDTRERQLLVHEFGHVAGCQHSDDPTDVMYPNATGAVLRCRSANA